MRSWINAKRNSINRRGAEAQRTAEKSFLAGSSLRLCVSAVKNVFHPWVKNRRSTRGGWTLENPGMARVVLENLTKVFPGHKGEPIRAVDNACLTLADGELVAIVGPSGCGKSTLLRLIAGLEDITGGTVTMDGRVMNQIEPKDRDFAMVFQNHALYPHLTARENLAFGLKLRHQPRAEIEERVGRAAEMLGLANCFDRLPAKLSGGERQRVAVGRAIVRQPKAFLFDEPLSNLDAQSRVQMRREIAALHKRLKATMLYVTHDQTEAMALGDRIAVMRAGVIEQVAEPLTLYHRPANMFVAGFIGSPPMNFFRGVMTKNVFNAECGVRSAESAEGASGFKLPVTDEMVAALTQYDGKKIVLGLRPEHITEKHEAKHPVPEWIVEALAEVIEPLGAETYLYAASAGQSFAARVQPGGQAGKVSFIFDLRHAHFFDPETGKAV
jgi:multiple sugar transport system ATP-binding protein